MAKYGRQYSLLKNKMLHQCLFFDAYVWRRYIAVTVRNMGLTIQKVRALKTIYEYNLFINSLLAGNSLTF